MKSESTDLSTLVAVHPFLAGMSPRHIELLAESVSLMRFESGQFIFRAGEEAHGFFLVESGSVNLEGAIAGKPHVKIDIVAAGEPLGWSWLFPPYLWQFDARATEPTAALFFDRTTLRKSCDDDLTLGNEIFKRISKVMVRRLQAARAKMIEVLHKTT
jgi:CRP-like cAMP-binding protein